MTHQLLDAQEPGKTTPYRKSTVYYENNTTIEIDLLELREVFWKNYANRFNKILTPPPRSVFFATIFEPLLWAPGKASTLI